MSDRPSVQRTEHTGEERYEVVLSYAADQVSRIARMTDEGQIIPDTVILVWRRRVGEEWKRYTNGTHGSRAEGYMKLHDAPPGAKGVRRTREVFTRSLGELSPWTWYLPGLRLAVEDVELQLP